MPITSTFGAMAARGFGLFSAIKQAIDEYFEYVTLLLPGNGTNGAQNNTFIDSSTNNFTITRNGNTTQGTFAPYGSNWSNYFNGSNTQLTAAANNAFVFGTGDFCIEGFFFVTADSISNIATIVSNTAGGNNGWIFSYYTGGFRFQSTGILLFQITSSLNTWHHVVICRASGTTSIFIDGVRQATTSTAYTWSDNSTLNIGYRGADAYFTGYMSNIRLVKGSSVYDPNATNITVPTAPLTAITNTSLLTCQSNRFIDNSTNNFTITRNGDVSVQVFSPFSPTASYAAGTIGGSGYFDGSGDYLDVANNNTFDTNSTYTFECWFYQPTAGNAMLFNRGGGVGNWNTTNGYQFTLLILSGVLYWEWNNAGVVATISVTTPNAGAWHHFAVGYNGTTTRAWVDGASIGTSTTGYTMPTTRTTIRIGADQSSPSSNPLTGYISGFRFVKGTDVYGVSNTTITVPTAPPTAITNTSLLLNFTNAGVIDNAMMNDLETVGDAQISTTQSKWGGASIAFDGTGDGLYRPYSEILTFRSGNFTVEFWMYFNSKSGYQTVASLGYTTNASNRWLIQTGAGDGKLIWYYSSVVATDTGSTVNTGQWYHIAIVKNGSTTTIYRDGVSVGSGADTNDYNPASNAQFYIGGGSSTGFDNYYFNGYIDDFRITKGVARYTANFTAPTAPFPTR